MSKFTVRELQPGAKVRVEFNAEIVGLTDPSNPYWYTVRYPSGELDTVSLARIHSVVDHTRAVLDTDCSMQVFSPRQSAEGALDLLLWLETHRREFEQATMPPDDIQAEEVDSDGEMESRLARRAAQYEEDKNFFSPLGGYE
jgi:hypothetical protein